MLINALRIPALFTCLAAEVGDLEYRVRHCQYYCVECGQTFAAAWRPIPLSNGYFEGGYFICPRCGVTHHRNAINVETYENVPVNMVLKVKEYKTSVILEVSGESYRLYDYLLVSRGRFRETFKFDLEKRVTTYKDNHPGLENKKELILGNPLNLEVYERSMLRYLVNFSLANKNQRPELTDILKTLRDTVRKKLEKILGHKTQSLFVSSGTYHGTFLLPILNIAYRVACPDAKNLPEIYREPIYEIKRYWKDKMLRETSEMIELETAGDYTQDMIFDRMLEAARKGKDYISELCAMYNLPDRTRVRKALAEDPFDAMLLNRIFSVCKNYDNAVKMHESIAAMHWSSREYYRSTPDINQELFDFLAIMKTIYGEKRMCRFISLAIELDTKDCIRLYNQLEEENKKALSKEVSPRELHDWLSYAHKKQNHENIKFRAPAHVIKRLSMQTDRLKFFLPKESLELLAAGHNLNNCVASYSQSVAKNQEHIVLVTDDDGKLVACLGIRDRQLIQAKIKNNAPVKKESEINQAVIEWANAAKLQINTHDVEQEEVKVMTVVSA